MVSLFFQAIQEAEGRIKDTLGVGAKGRMKLLWPHEASLEQHACLVARMVPGFLKVSEMPWPLSLLSFIGW